MVLATGILSRLSTLSVVNSLEKKNSEGKVIGASCGMWCDDECRLGTHDGHFHCDECLAVGMLKLLPEFESASVLRTRDPGLLERCDIVVDVGGVYEASSRRFDHHQRGFEETMTEFGRRTKLSSAGLTYRHFGREVLENILEPSSKRKRSVSDDLVRRVYVTFVEHVDGIDNGQDSFFEAGEARYEVSTSLSRRVGRLNPRWNEDQSDVDERFARAVSLCASEFLDHCADVVDGWLPARDVVRHAVAAGGPVILLETYCPWDAHIFDLEPSPGETKYVVYPDTKGSFRVQAVPLREGSFQSRLPLPEPWRGLRDDALSHLVGVDDCIFVHASGFIGGAKTKLAALALANKALAHHAQPID